MDEHGLAPNVVTFTALLKVFASAQRERERERESKRGREGERESRRGRVESENARVHEDNSPTAVERIRHV